MPTIAARTVSTCSCVASVTSSSSPTRKSQEVSGNSYPSADTQSEAIANVASNSLAWGSPTNQASDAPRFQRRSGDVMISQRRARFFRHCRWNPGWRCYGVWFIKVRFGASKNRPRESVNSRGVSCEIVCQSLVFNRLLARERAMSTTLETRVIGTGRGIPISFIVREIPVLAIIPDSRAF